MKIKICRREAKESGYWLRLLDTGEKLEVQRDDLVGEATELMKIFGAIIRKSEEWILVWNFEFVSDFDIRVSYFRNAI